MLRHRSVSTVESLALDLSEDLATRWVPDALADVDLLEQLSEPRLERDDLAAVDVPRADGGMRSAPVLSGAALRALRDAVQGLRETSEHVLDPAVCGYRTGASGDSSYSDEYRRFRAMAEAMSDEHGYVIMADVRTFFESVDVDAVSSTMASTVGSAWESVARFLKEVRNLGVPGLPAGYGDARLVANLILSSVDESIQAPFTRWVDDYRIFVDSSTDVGYVLWRLSGALAPLGLRLNDRKLQVLDASEYRTRRHGAPLDSVYHPQDEPVATVRANLRSTFLRAVSTENRRMLRFALPRLAEQEDDIAVNYALWALASDSIDAPRLVQYLSAFVNDADVIAGANDLITERELTPWTVGRLSPILTRVALSERSTRALEHRLRTTTEQPAVWGALLRVLAVHGRTSIVRESVESIQVPDPRAAIAACRDMGWVVPDVLKRRAPNTWRAVDMLPSVPLPSAESLL